MSQNSSFVLTAVSSSRAEAQYRAALERQGFEVAAAADGFETVDLALHGRPSLIVLDEQLPGLSAASVCSMLKARAASDHIPIIVLCSHQSDRALRERLVEAGADQVLVEPCAELLGVEAKRLARPPSSVRPESVRLRRRSADARLIPSS